MNVPRTFRRGEPRRSYPSTVPETSPSDALEVEWQFDALDLRPVQRWVEDIANRHTEARQVKGAAHRQVDTYLDTDDWRLFRAGFSLRVRKRRGGTEATLKALSPPSGALRRRREITEPVPAADPRTVLATEGPVGARVRAMVGRRQLGPVVEVRTLRTPFRLSQDGREVAELVLDQTTIPVSPGQAPARLRRVEIEAAEPSALVDTLVAELERLGAVHPSRLSKFEAALMAVGRSPAVPDLGPVGITEQSSIGEVAFASLRRHVAAMLDHEPGTRLGEDPEELHDMRVATRRLRAALALFDGVLPVRAQALREQLRWVASALGAVRDLDVQMEQLASWELEAEDEDRSALAALAETLRDEQAGAREAMMAVLNSARYDRLVRSLEGFARRGPSRRDTRARAPSLLEVPELIEARYAKVRRAGDRIGPAAGPEAYHRLRIRCKRLRYALEFVAPLYPKEAPSFIKAVTKAQDILGLHQDAQVAMARLRGLAGDREAPLPPETIFAMGRVAERYNARSAKLRSRLPKAYGRVLGRDWKRLERAMKHRRPESAPAEQAPPPATPDAPRRSPP
jgi:triphosphatase